MGWYKTGSVSLVQGNSQIVGVGTDFITNVSPGGIFCGPDGKIYEVDYVISATALSLVKPYAGNSIAGAAYAIAPTQSYIVDLARQAATLLSTFSGFRDDYIAGKLVGAGLQLKGVLASAALLPPAGVDGDAYLIAGSLYVWAKIGWASGSIQGPKGDDGNVNPQNLTAAASALDSKTQAAASATAAALSQANAAGSATAAAGSATAGQASKAAAAASETAAAGSATAAQTSKTAAAASETAAAGSAAAALASKVAAATSEANAGGSATSATASKSAAAVSETNAKTSETNSKASELASKSSETAAAASAGSVAAQAADASTAAAAARDWATKTAAEVVVGQGFGAKKYANDAAASAAAAAQSALQASAGQVNADWNAVGGVGQILNKPTIPSTPAGVGLGNVNNTSDANKPVSTLQAAAIAAKEPAIVAGTAAQYWRGDKTWQALDKGAVGLANVDNTPDANKPVSTPQAAAIAAKASLAGASFTGPVNEAPSTSIASAATVNLGGATGNLIDVTGTVAISAITLADGAERTVRFTGVLTLKNGASLVLLSGADIVTAAGDFAVFRGYPGGVVRMVTYSKASGAALVVPNSIAGLIRSARTANAMLGAADKGVLVDVTSGTFTQTFDAPGTLGNGWWCYIRNSGTGDITVTMDGLTYLMYPNEVRLVQCDATQIISIVIVSFSKKFINSATFIKPPGYANFDVVAWPGGQSGGGGGGGSGNSWFGASGGKGGEGLTARIPASLVGVTEVVTIGAGGIGPAGSTYLLDASSPVMGGTTSFGSILSVATSAANDQGSFNNGGPGGGATSRTSDGNAGGAARLGAGGGGSGGGGGYATSTPGGIAGTSVLAGKGGDGGASGVGGTNDPGKPGTDGVAPGGGGGGGGAGGFNSTASGGKGGNGARGELQIKGA